METTDKRTLKRQYLETKSRAGVYAIRNLVTCRILVAGSSNAQAAINRHSFELRLGKHRNKLLQQEWSAHGADNFTFEVLDLVKPRDDAGFNAASELEVLLALWRHEMLRDDGMGYDGEGSTP